MNPAGSGDYQHYEVKVRHILITWKGKSASATPKDPERTEEQARKLATELETRAKEGEDFVKLQLEYNEDSTADKVYDVNPTSAFVEPFKKLAASLPPGGVGNCESQFGIHIMKRIE
jgi:parvulin-like peptidyl-prolyl isomerase